ncbi:hypothetical protein [Ilumatobacter coccineus]|uniref:Uncharacterized protein n=1 Tax=Ilumatobacter coccineus (strain NBRC 103263 / KCTC 29153 / YM16-304) TaxID=1313172 RepID=A0A6C7EDG5_ILUCY|nr:hypothetical protein [Ilumatobacter coccineus]BAN04410.1 hypothetical protein YM304_40960 [Ilumatobacter coccineus YM16-304]
MRATIRKISKNISVASARSVVSRPIDLDRWPERPERTPSVGLMLRRSKKSAELMVAARRDALVVSALPGARSMDDAPPEIGDDDESGGL